MTILRCIWCFLFDKIFDYHTDNKKPVFTQKCTVVCCDRDLFGSFTRSAQQHLALADVDSFLPPLINILHMLGLAVGKVAEGTARLRAEAEKKWKIFKASALQVWCILTCCVKILCVSLGCDFGTVPLCTGQIPFEMQEGRGISLLSANPWAQALLVKEEGHSSQPKKNGGFLYSFYEEVIFIMAMEVLNCLN